MGYPLPHGYSPRGNLQGAASASFMAVSASTTSQLIFDVTAERGGAVFFNNTPANAYISLAPSASLGGTPMWTTKVPPSSSWTLPTPAYILQISVVFDATGVGYLQATQMLSPEYY